MFNIAICDDEETLIDELKENLIMYLEIRVDLLKKYLQLPPIGNSTAVLKSYLVFIKNVTKILKSKCYLYISILSRGKVRV